MNRTRGSLLLDSFAVCPGPQGWPRHPRPRRLFPRPRHASHSGACPRLLLTVLTLATRPNGTAPEVSGLRPEGLNLVVSSSVPITPPAPRQGVLTERTAQTPLRKWGAHTGRVTALLLASATSRSVGRLQPCPRPAPQLHLRP